MNEDTPIRKQLLSIPNLMGYFRILLIPVIVWRYVTAETVMDYYIAAVMIGISGITDFLDGFVARRFHMITKVGKALDPIADKLTQGAIPYMFALMVLFVVKEGFMGIMGIIMLRKGKMLDGAKWFGKVCTAVLYVVMFLLIAKFTSAKFFPETVIIVLLSWILGFISKFGLEFAAKILVKQ